MLQPKKFPIRCSFGDKTLKGNKQNNDVSMESILNKTNNETTTIVMRSSSSQKKAQEDQSELENQEQIII